ncbi:protein spire homolog 1-like [Pyxicephalus adspersus]|uniref:protein spire homolog 1-like n=1 Tax=Pyxicephalus adspersus TaxID=30357 RepID=UPI003B5BBA77
MTDWGSSEPRCKVTLHEIMKSSGQPISEEQAWALCYQCSAKLKQMMHTSRLLPGLKGLESICIHQDGEVSFVVSGMPGAGLSEEKVIEQLGKAVYSALDWGLGSDTERVLSDKMLYLLYRMVGLSANCTSPSIELWKVTLDEVLKVCIERLFLPSEAPGHYKAVCRKQYGVYAEICNLLQTIKQSKQNLMKLETNERDDSAVFDNWSSLWKGVMNEMRIGMNLCRSRHRSYNAQPIEYELAPYELLMEDIRCRRYTLRKVQDCDQSKSSKSEDNIILDLIRSLKPASARKLREKPQEEPSLHELLMSEIKSSRSKLRSAMYGKKVFSQDEEFRIADGQCSAPRDHPFYRRRLESRWNLPMFDLPDNQIETRVSWNTEFSQESSLEQKFFDLTSSSSEISFLPVWTSSQLDLRMSCCSTQVDRQTRFGSTSDKCMSSGSSHERLAFGHKRSSSFEAFAQGEAQDEQGWDSSRVSLPPTVLELAPLRRMMVKTEMPVFMSSRDVLGQKACSSCRKKLLCWRVLCKFCERNICPECRVEMLMPHQKCMHLPVSFFKALVLSQESDLTRAKELNHWNSSSVPLVMFRPKNVSGDFSFHKRIIHNWTSMSICVRCQEYILDMIKRNGHWEVPGGSLKSRSMSVSATPFSRH